MSIVVLQEIGKTAFAISGYSCASPSARYLLSGLLLLPYSFMPLTSVTCAGWFTTHSTFPSLRRKLRSRLPPPSGCRPPRPIHGASSSFMTVPLGDYVLTVTHADFAATSQVVTVTSGSSPIAHIQLAKGPALAPITVTAAVDTAVPNTATPTTVVSREDIERTPGAQQTNNLAMITDFVPGAYVVHDQLHVRGGHQTTWEVDGVEIPNTNIASNLGPQIDPKDIDYLEIERGSYEADEGDRTYGIFNVVPRTGFERDDQAEVIASGGNYGQTNDYLSVGSHSERFAYYASVSGNRSDLGIQTPVAQIIHDSEDGYAAFNTLIFNPTPDDQFRAVFSARRDSYDIPNTPGQIADDVQRETDVFAILSWVRKLSADATLTTSFFFHQNRADLDGSPNDYPISTTDQRSSSYVGGQEALRWHVTRNDIQVGVTGFSQQDHESFNVLFNDGSNPPVYENQRPTGSLVAGYVQDTFKATDWLQIAGGVRQTHFASTLTENATSPRIGSTVRLPGLDWILRGFWGKYYQAPPLTTLSGPLLAYAQNSNLASCRCTVSATRNGRRAHHSAEWLDHRRRTTSTPKRRTSSITTTSATRTSFYP